MKKRLPPSNPPTLVCAECQGSAPAYENWVTDNDGRLHLMHVDPWPAYFRDVLDWRTEFCSAACGLNYMKKSSTNS